MKNTGMPVVIIAGAAAVIFLLTGMWIYYDKSVQEIEQQGSNAAVYDRHYIMVSEENSALWQSIYGSAREAAAEGDVYLEWVTPSSFSDYTLKDCMNIGIAAKVDGIIVHPDGSHEITESIDEAVGQGIPVVTVLNDDGASGRISFVGVSSYQLGQTYGEQILKSLQDGYNKVLVLLNSYEEDINTNLMYSQMNSIVEKGKKAEQQVEFSYYAIDSATNFEAEEVIRDIFVNPETLPDILICLDSISTECASQAIVDYNQVGNVDIIGYYASDVTLNAISKGLLPSTISVDTEEIGQCSIRALNEYLTQGNVSNYFNVGLKIITDTNVRQYLAQQ